MRLYPPIKEKNHKIIKKYLTIKKIFATLEQIEQIKQITQLKQLE